VPVREALDAPRFMGWTGGLPLGPSFVQFTNGLKTRTEGLRPAG